MGFDACHPFVTARYLSLRWQGVLFDLSAAGNIVHLFPIPCGQRCRFDLNKSLTRRPFDLNPPLAIESIEFAT